MTIHWCGTGLSAVPGLRRLLADGQPVVVWNLTIAAAAAVVGDLARDIRVYETEALSAALCPGDVVVSMLPSDMHAGLARLALAARAHFVCSSYATPELRALDAAARAAGVAIVAEMGLDPGIDHMMAHDLVAAYRASAAYDAENTISFTSFCGGVPARPNAFRYKFSWSPIGVLKALGAPSRSIRHFAVLAVARPWEAITRFDAPLPVPETFEVYPNRDSLPFIAEYGFDPKWPVKNFVRGTIRLMGWAAAWAPVFAELESLTGPGRDARLSALSNKLWAANAYAADEPDRAVLVVSFKAEREGRAVWHQSWALDAVGDLRGSAMARLVSGPAAMAAESLQLREFPAGVQGVPADPRLLARWLGQVQPLAQYMARRDHLQVRRNTPSSASSSEISSAFSPSSR
ncbi:saccharopine dehydrogenase C-terminal domain-containing protein [Phaeovulum sp.]|uniref:saccharopine dehydrogenase C-terminal domain-containing protein n=1 Tax=Phaeovulum sp. TaxID=2934796 RepID=UPI0027320BE1|nr:saccharopine dehydrogenase C-terminal domain-containing protein [Phaeovulum sp.]MDP1668956.1 saccharopine dehydrogenase C-terminal domain-containing protein [Phaeovulum sp.]MDZ4119227.1 saccharopine dehydrogenase C-terminal domain-containing protein [Phaeovulum sp.]